MIHIIIVVCFDLHSIIRAYVMRPMMCSQITINTDGVSSARTQTHRIEIAVLDVRSSAALTQNTHFNPLGKLTYHTNRNPLGSSINPHNINGVYPCCDCDDDDDDDDAVSKRQIHLSH